MKFAKQPGTHARLDSLDQFRGYTVAGMFLVNYIGGFALIHDVFKHVNTFCSYADTIMPQFFFAVGFAYRLTFLRGSEKEGVRAAYRHAIRRNLTLLVIGQLIYDPDPLALIHGGLLGLPAYLCRVGAFQTLTHIGVTCLWILPVIRASVRVRLAFMAVSGALHLGLSYGFYYDWLWAHGVTDGGPLGFLSWTIPTLAGSLAYDLIVRRGVKNAIRPLFGVAILFMALGYGFSCLNAVHHSLSGDATATGLWKWFVEPPFMAPSRGSDLWTMSQTAGSISYLTFCAGFSMFVLSLCVVLCDVKGFHWGVFRTLGQNALMGYFLGGVIEAATTFWMPKNAPVLLVLMGFCLFFATAYGVMRLLEWKRLYLRL